MQHDIRVRPIKQGASTILSEEIVANLGLLAVSSGSLQLFTNSCDVTHPATWSPDGTWLTYERREGLVVVPSSGGPERIIYKGKLWHPSLSTGDLMAEYPKWSRDGTRLLFAVREDGETELYCVDSKGTYQRRVNVTQDYLLGWDWCPDDRSAILLLRSEDGLVTSVVVLDVEQGTLQVLWDEPECMYQKPTICWLPDGQRLLIRSNRTGWSKIWMVDMVSGEQRQVTQGEQDDYAFRLSPDGRRIVFATRCDPDTSGDSLWIQMLDSREGQQLTHSQGIHVPIAWTPQEQVLYWYSSPTEADSLWSIPADGGEPKRVTYNTPLLLQRKLVTPVEVRVPSFSGVQTHTLVYRPVYYQEGERYPAIVWIRGGPANMCRPRLTPLFSWLANQGYVVITPNYCGSVGYGLRHMHAIIGDGVGGCDLADIIAAADFARTLPYVSSPRGIGVGGHSWGGYLALLAVAKFPETFCCAVAGASISDWATQQSLTNIRYYDYWLLGGWIYERPNIVADRSPITFINNIKVPLLLYHGAQDKGTPILQYKRFVEGAFRLGLNVEEVTYPGEGHVLKNRDNQRDLMCHIQQFYQRHLKAWNCNDIPVAAQQQL